MESVRSGQKGGLFEEVPRAETQMNGRSMPCACLKTVVRGNSSVEPLEDGEQEVPPFDELLKAHFSARWRAAGGMMGDRTRHTSGGAGWGQERADGGSV